MILIRSDLRIIETHFRKSSSLFLQFRPVRIFDMVTELSLHFQVSFHFSPHLFLSIPLFRPAQLLQLYLSELIQFFGDFLK
jgi:hypothetical protein